MTPLQFETAHAPQWQALETALDLAENKARARARQAQRQTRPDPKSVDAAQLSALYRRSCEHLALAQARAYPIHLTQRLEQLTQRAHRLIYRRQDLGLGRLRRLVLIDFPQSVRLHRGYLLVAALLFVVPTLLVGWATWRDPGFILHLVDAAEVRRFDQMYGDGQGALGRVRSANTDWTMFGFYIMHNIGIGFQCFAGGLFAGVGSVYYLFFNGVFGGGVAGYLTARGHAENFYSFVVTHSAFELTAIVLSGAAGLRLGHALLAPERRTRLQALQHAAHDAIVVVYGVIGLLVVAAAVEAFWSSARWVAPGVKYGVGAACWGAVLAYLGWQGRPPHPRPAEGAHAA
ncbi:MAG TPA: stage II sporulation protein M [Rhizobacter sp.]|nr:stage II sporulation protein M [Rhizobacter sp.]